MCRNHFSCSFPSYNFESEKRTLRNRRTHIFKRAAFKSQCLTTWAVVNFEADTQESSFVIGRPRHKLPSVIISHSYWKWRFIVDLPLFKGVLKTSSPKTLTLLAILHHSRPQTKERLALGIMGMPPKRSRFGPRNVTETSHAKHVTNHVTLSSQEAQVASLACQDFACCLRRTRLKNIFFYIEKEKCECWYSSFELMFMKLSPLAMSRNNLGCHKRHYKWQAPFLELWFLDSAQLWGERYVRYVLMMSLSSSLKSPECKRIQEWLRDDVSSDKSATNLLFSMVFVRHDDPSEASCMSAASSCAPNGSAILRTLAGSSHGRDHFRRGLDTDPKKRTSWSPVVSWFINPMKTMNARAISCYHVISP